MNSHSQVVVYWSLTSNLNTPSTRQALVFSFTSCVKKDNVEQVGWEQHTTGLPSRRVFGCISPPELLLFAVLLGYT